MPAHGLDEFVERPKRRPQQCQIDRQHAYETGREHDQLDRCRRHRHGHRRKDQAEERKHQHCRIGAEHPPEQRQRVQPCTHGCKLPTPRRSSGQRRRREGIFIEPGCRLAPVHIAGRLAPFAVGRLSGVDRLPAVDEPRHRGADSRNGETGARLGRSATHVAHAWGGPSARPQWSPTWCRTKSSCRRGRHWWTPTNVGQISANAPSLSRPPGLTTRDSREPGAEFGRMNHDQVPAGRHLITVTCAQRRPSRSGGSYTEARRARVRAASMSPKSRSAMS